MSLFQLGDFTLSSGARSDFKIECDALSDDDIKFFAHAIAKLVGPFSSVEGVPRGGLRLAEALCPLEVCVCGNYRRAHDTIGAHEFQHGHQCHLIVDDVLTTGRSMTELAQQSRGKRPDLPRIMGAVMFARGPVPYWIKCVFTLSKELWLSPIS